MEQLQAPKRLQDWRVWVTPKARQLIEQMERWWASTKERVTLADQIKRYRTNGSRSERQSDTTGGDWRNFIPPEAGITRRGLRSEAKCAGKHDHSQAGGAVVHRQRARRERQMEGKWPVRCASAAGMA